MPKHLTPAQDLEIKRTHDRHVAEHPKQKTAIKEALAAAYGVTVGTIYEAIKRAESAPESESQSDAPDAQGTILERAQINAGKHDFVPNQIEVFSNKRFLAQERPAIQENPPDEGYIPIEERFVGPTGEAKPPAPPPQDRTAELLEQISRRLSNLESKVNAPFVHTPDAEIKVELSREVTTEMFLSDLHWHPEHGEGNDPAAWELVKCVIENIQPDIIYFGGDILDCYAPARYEGTPRLKTPEAYDGEIHFGRIQLADVRRIAPNSRFVWLTGNHEERVKKSIFSDASWLYNRLQSVEDDLRLSEFDCSLVRDGHKIGKLAHYHGDKIPGGGRVNVAKNKFDRLIGNFIFGHHHRFSKWMPKNTDGGYYGAFGNATTQWLAPGYAPHNDWQQGFSVVQYAKSGNFHVDQILIHKPGIWSPKAEAIYGGVHYKVDMEKSR